MSLACFASVPIVAAQVSGFEPPGGEISGVVRSQADKRPASQVLVTLKAGSAGISRNVLTDANGHFAAGGLPPDTYEVLVEEPGYEPYRSSTRLKGASAELAVYLKPSRAAQIRRVDATVSVRELKIPRKAREEYQKGVGLLDKSDPAGSLSHFVKAAEAFPGFYEAYYHEGVAEMRLGHWDAAMEAYQLAVDLSGGRFAWAQFAIGYLLCREDKPGEAEAILRRGLEVERDSPEGYVILGNALMLLNRPEEAEKTIDEALARDPNFADAYLVRSNIFAHKGEFHKRLQDLDAYLRLEPSGQSSESIRQAREETLRILAKSQPQD